MTLGGLWVTLGDIGCHWGVSGCPPPLVPPPNSPPVPVELAVPKAQHLGHHVEAGVEKPIEEDEPDEVVGNLGGGRGGLMEIKGGGLK